MNANGESLIRDTDLLFLRGIVESPVIDKLKENTVQNSAKPLITNIRLVCEEIIAQLDQENSFAEAKELKNILNSSNFKSLLACHDSIASPKTPNPVPNENVSQSEEGNSRNSIPQLQEHEEFIKTAGIIKKPGIPLGLSVIDRGSDIIIHRILVGSYIEKLGLLKRGDIIREVNENVFEKAEDLQDYISQTEGTIIFKLAVKIDQPDPVMTISPYIKAYFTYRPDRDTHLPDKHIGLAFSAGDVLQVFDKTDKLYWQAENINSHETGLIPSEWLEDRRRTRKIQKESKKTQLTNDVKTKLFSASNSQDFDRCDCQIYESVARMPPFKRKMLVLIGAIGVGRDSLLKRLIKSDPSRFKRPKADTSRAKSPDVIDKYNFMSREAIESGIKSKEYLEHGEYNGNLYGLRFKSITQIINENKIVVLDVNPWTLRYLKTPQFMPFIVHIKSPSFEVLKERQRSQLEKGLIQENNLRDDGDFRRTVIESERLEKEYAHYFDSRIVNNDFEQTFQRLLRETNELETKHQWVPTSWVF